MLASQVPVGSAEGSEEPRVVASVEASEVVSEEDSVVDSEEEALAGTGARAADSEGREGPGEAAREDMGDLAAVVPAAKHHRRSLSQPAAKWLARAGRSRCRTPTSSNNGRRLQVRRA